jgi:hypothetical protein
MREPSNARVPFTGTKGRIHLLSESAAWIYHNMASGTLDGDEPSTATTTPSETVPTVKAGRADYNDLTHGGLFVHPWVYNKAVVVEAIDNPGSATLLVTNPAAGTNRAAPASVPFTIAPGECLKAVGGTKVGFMMREDLPWR